MPRIRTIKPEFWTDPVMVRLSPLARLFYIGTWNFAMCDQGHLEDDPFRLKLQILPAEDCDASALIDELVDAGRLVRMEVEGDAYLHVRTLADHQKVDGRWAPRCPVCKHLASPNPTETPARLGETHRDSPKRTAVKERKGREGKGSPAPAAPSRASARPSPDRFEEFWSHYPRKRDRGHAEKAWKAATKKADPQVIIDGLLAQIPALTSGDKKFIPYGATWLNGQRWEDELTTGDMPKAAGWWNQ